MTAQEAIDILRNAAWLGSDADRDRTEEAIEVALKALESAQPEKRTEKRTETHACDSISRHAAIDLFPNDALEWDTKGGYIAPHLARRMIEELPPVQPQPRNGGWRYYLGKCICVACGAEFDESSLYCPKCGTFNGGEQ